MIIFFFVENEKLSLKNIAEFQLADNRPAVVLNSGARASDSRTSYSRIHYRAVEAIVLLIMSDHI